MTLFAIDRLMNKDVLKQEYFSLHFLWQVNMIYGIHARQSARLTEIGQLLREGVITPGFTSKDS